MSTQKLHGKALLVYIEPTPYVLSLVDRLARAWPDGIDVVFLGANLSQPWQLPLEHGVPDILPRPRGAAARSLQRRIRSGQYAIVHLAGWGHPLLFLTMIFSRLSGLPIAVETDTPLSLAQSWTRLAAKRVLYPALFRMPSIFLPGGTRQRRYLQHYGVPDDRITVAQMTVDVTAIAAYVGAIAPDVRRDLREKIGLPARTCAFLFVGRLEPAKGVETLLQAYCDLVARRDDVRLLVVGDGAYGGMLRVAASKVPGLKWLGRLDGTALLDVYAAADVHVLPSKFEPWGLVVNEAMAAGLPVIASRRVGCVDDLVIDGETGFVVEADSRSALADAMNRLADDASLRQAMGAAARQRISSWTIEAEAKIVVGAWHRALRT